MYKERYEITSYQSPQSQAFQAVQVEDTLFRIEYGNPPVEKKVLIFESLEVPCFRFPNKQSDPSFFLERTQEMIYNKKVYPVIPVHMDWKDRHINIFLTPATKDKNMVLFLNKTAIYDVEELCAKVYYELMASDKQFKLFLNTAE